MPPLIIVSGPSGSGKSTLIKRVVARYPAQLRLAVSATTRPPRPGEKEGRDYSFWTTAQFEQALKEGAFLEHAIVHGKHYYGTPKREVEDAWKAGQGVILDIDVQGWDQVRDEYEDHLSVFVSLPEMDVYRQRLRERGESEESIERRMKTAEAELARRDEYQKQITNDDLERATAKLTELIRKRFPGWLPD